MKIEYSKFNSLGIFELNIKAPGYPALDMNLNLDGKYNKKFSIPGFGIYALSYKQKNNKDLLFYVGMFSGEDANAMSGDARSRWFKHIATATLLHINLKWRSKKKIFHEIKRIKNFKQNNSTFINLANNSLINLNNKDIEKKLIKPNGLQISENRMRFSMQNFSDFHKGRPNTLKELKFIISKFSCHYWKFDTNKKLTKKDIFKKLENSETEVIEKFKRKLPMNKEFEVYKKENFYHYNPDQLIEVGTKEFKSFSEYVINTLKKHND